MLWFEIFIKIEKESKWKLTLHNTWFQHCQGFFFAFQALLNAGSSLKNIVGHIGAPIILLVQISDGVSASKSEIETKTEIWPFKTETRLSETETTPSKTETLRIRDQDET